MKTEPLITAIAGVFVVFLGTSADVCAQAAPPQYAKSPPPLPSLPPPPEAPPVVPPVPPGVTGQGAPPVYQQYQDPSGGAAPNYGPHSVPQSLRPMSSSADEEIDRLSKIIEQQNRLIEALEARIKELESGRVPDNQN